ncbi:MAG: type II secretion system protein GspG [Bacteroidia bacterium]
MADLKNSQRINYKATYNQISPGISDSRDPKDPKHPGNTLKRGLEKAAFIQSLRIAQQELIPLKGHFIERDANKKESIKIFNAIELLVNDKTSSSTLNNASNFSEIHYSKLLEVAHTLVEYRDRIAETIDRNVAEIILKYKESHQRPTSNEIKDTAIRENPEKLNERTKTEFSTNATGIPVKTIIYPTEVSAKNDSKDKEKRQVKSFKSDLSVDQTKSLFNPVISEFTKATTDTFKYSTKDAIEWAERNQPDLFNNFYNNAKPYLTSREIANTDKINFLMRFMATNYSSYFDGKHTKGAIAGFEARMNVEPVGNLHLERIEMYPAGIERGELIHSVPLAPAETVNISHKEWSVRQQEFEDIVQDYFEGYSEEGVAEKNDLAMSNESQTKHATALNVGASLSASYSSVTLSTSFGYNATSDDQQSKKDSRNHSMAITKKASARTKKDHKITFKVTSIVGSEDQSVRVITNPSDTDAMRIDYFQLARKWKANLLRYGLRMTYDIVIPDPGSALITKVRQVKDLDALINVPFSFPLPLTAIWYNSLATDPHFISNYDQLAAQYDASVTAPPEAIKYVNVHKETAEVQHYDYVNFDSLEFEIDEQYYIHAIQWNWAGQINDGETRNYFNLINLQIADLMGKSGKLALDIMFQYMYNFVINIEFTLRPKVQVLLDWRLQVWNQLRQAAEEHYYKSIQNYKDERAQLIAEINNYNTLTLRKMEQEEIMKGVLRWIFGPNFFLVPFNIASLFGSDSNDPEVQDVLDPNKLTMTQWQEVLEHGEFIKYIHNAIEWENVLYFTYPYFWDDNKLWDFKKFLFHPDPTHNVFLRSGAARVVLTIRPGFEDSFTQLVENGAFSTLPGPHPYVTIAQEIQNFAKTNYPGFPPANPEQNARPLLYLEQRRVWKEMQYIIQLMDAFKADPPNNGHFPGTIAGNAVPSVQLTPYLNGVIVINGVNYNGINDYNTQANAKQLALDPKTTLEALLPTYANVPVNDYWNNPYFYKSPGDTGDYDLISFGADGQLGGVDKDSDISANAEASLIATWFEYTPVNALDIGITINAPNATPPAIKPDIA